MQKGFIFSWAKALLYMDCLNPTLKRLCENGKKAGRRNFQVAVLLKKRKLKLAATIKILIFT
ncbi:MAG: hypothetical protein A2499_11605 [Stygiobacter sp. RIFOXYC12_FULL_38_8]|nr:MAG: hypothetical protein A2279_10220 [Stygiobacter sp. RIFOXYA12_FULL_38_9]OGV09424.1 MAG: hypothetical protein A2299_13780 [Stygiobacter sp. RIFOXYB2_FULL_37_11]OGV11312.1 MAG: hypothetical protein A2237_15805 [Stygiobacter sp. RIFOXYA2_FULL_38_8]OGV15348.1 MAG: hypothetical protein A2440_07895 [Stygiobacter sp. RIFOXYC2_FULL_38_25]OGV30489.1 MAG: hypothetical protein A2499_11605 [Stygiobacter sp. RIFOXYC12_FULL_38_8]OGV79086.1 MAG: hypothetical protein A2X65_08345 [Stygiobacter sp. GWF2_